LPSAIITGQDGSYPVELLRFNGYRVSIMSRKVHAVLQKEKSPFYPSSLNGIVKVDFAGLVRMMVDTDLAGLRKEIT
jgi:hypothetical protein